MKICTNCNREATGKYKVCGRCRESMRKSKRKRREMVSRSIPEKGHRYCMACKRQWPLEHFQSIINHRKELTTSCATGKYKLCGRCRESLRKSKRKRRERVSRLIPEKGHRYCMACKRQWSLEHFQSIINRRKELTTSCATCRLSLSKYKRGENSVVGQCKLLYEEWKVGKVCEICHKAGGVLEADHIDRSTKIHNCSNYQWWGQHGGPEKLKEELLKCRPLHPECHRLHTKTQFSGQKQASILEKQHYVNEAKLMISCCAICKKKVYLKTVSCFEFDHLNPDEAYECGIGKMVASYSLKRFYELIERELERCRLLCISCHRTHTNSQFAKKRLILERLVQESK